MEGGRSDPRNVILHQMFSYLGFGERAGSGLYMIRKTWENKNWIKPELKDELNPNRTILTLYMRKNYSKNYSINYSINKEDSYEKIYNNITQIQAKILEVIKDNPSITAKQLSNIITEIKYDAIRWNIGELKKKGILRREGSRKRGNWIIIK